MKELTRRYQFDYQEFSKYTGAWNTRTYLAKSFDSLPEIRTAIEEAKQRFKNDGEQVKNFRIIELLRSVIWEESNE